MKASLVKFLHLRRYLCNASGGTNMSTVPQLRKQGLLGYMLHTGGSTCGVIYNQAKDCYGLISVAVSNKDSYNKAKGRAILTKCVQHLTNSNATMSLDEPQEVLVPDAATDKVMRSKAKLTAVIQESKTKLVDLRTKLALPRDAMTATEQSAAVQELQEQITKESEALVQYSKKLQDFDLSKGKFEYRFCWYSSPEKLTADLMRQANVSGDVVFESLAMDSCYQLTKAGMTGTFRLVVLGYKKGKYTVAFVSTDAPFNRFEDPVEISTMCLTDTNRAKLGLTDVMIRPFREKYGLVKPELPTVRPTEQTKKHARRTTKSTRVLKEDNTAQRNLIINDREGY